MRLATLHTPAGLRLHVRTPGGYVDLGAASGDERFSTLGGLLAAAPESLEVAAAVPPGDDAPEPVYGPAVPAPGKIFCLGRNYADHAEEMRRTTSEWPEVFLRLGSCIAGPFDDVVLPSFSQRCDYEGELGVVIGTGGRHILAERALETIAGYVVADDVSVRDWQHRGQQWTPGKNFEQTLPVGPELVTADELDAADLRIETRVNGELVQSARTSTMIVSIPHQIEFISSFVTLSPGDLIVTGTPAGVGTAREPPRFLAEGDVVEVSVEGIGSIRNTMRRDGAAAPERWVWLAEEAVSRPVA